LTRRYCSTGAKGDEGATEVNLERLARRTSSGRYMPEVDGVRCLAIFMVLLVHLAGALSVARGASLVRPFGGIVVAGAPAGSVGTDWLAKVMLQGKYGVQLFFVLSGFILGLPFLQRRRGLKPYYLRRLTRLEPPYLIALLVCATIGSAFVSASLILKGAAILVPYLSTPISGGSALNVTYWSLAVEIQFYLVLPLLAWVFFRKQSRLLLVGAIAITQLLQLRYVVRWPRAYLSIPGSLQFFLVGMLLADVYIHSREIVRKYERSWDLGGLIALIVLACWPLAMTVTSSHTMFFEFILLPWLAAGIIGAALFGRWTHRAFANRWIRTPGGMAYSIYLVHFPVMMLFALGTSTFWRGGSFDSHLLPMAVVLLPLVLGVGLGFYLLVEQPCMDPDWPRRLGARARLFFRRRAIANPVTVE
jgi:peptidoglycan/LPS O-acetylase OafA/YrhL